MILAAPVPLAAGHDVSHFRCGVPSLDDWIRRRALPNQVSDASRTYVLQDREFVVAYYALASGAISSTSATTRFRRNMPDPIPVVVLARLAVSQSHWKFGIGRGLIRDAAMRVMHAGDAIGIRGIIVHALSPDARDFYVHAGFDPSPLDPMTLMITVSDLRNLMME